MEEPIIRSKLLFPETGEQKLDDGFDDSPVNTGYDDMKYHKDESIRQGKKLLGEKMSKEVDDLKEIIKELIDILFRRGVFKKLEIQGLLDKLDKDEEETKAN